MRPISSLNHSTFSAAAAAASGPSIGQPRSPWHSPVPYLFGGLAAMLGLIAFALLILACSYWRLSSRLDDGEGGEDQQRDLENGKDEKPERVFEEKFLVIMAGNQKPTFLATPVSSRASALGEKNNSETESKDGADGKKMENEEKSKEEMGCSSPGEETRVVQRIPESEEVTGNRDSQTQNQ